MQCPVCSTPNPPGMRFCTNCGQPLEAAASASALKCPACGQALKPGSRFCTSCGQPLAAGRDAAAPSARPEPAPPVGPGVPTSGPPPSPGAPPAFPASAPPQFQPGAAPPAQARPPLVAPPPAVPGPIAPSSSLPRSRSGAFYAGLAVALVLLGVAGYLAWNRFFRAAPSQAQLATPAAQAGGADRQPEVVQQEPAVVQTGPAESGSGSGAALTAPGARSVTATGASPTTGRQAAAGGSRLRGDDQRTATGAPAESAQASAPAAALPQAAQTATSAAAEPGTAPQPGPTTAPPAARAAQRPEILRPEPEVPPAPRREETRATPSQAEAQTSGLIIWSGPLKRGEIVTIEGDRASSGTLRGALPGIPVMIETDFRGIGFTEMPGPSNGWKRLAFRSLRDQNVVVTLRWRAF